MRRNNMKKEVNKQSFSLDLTQEELERLYEKAAVGGLTPDKLLENFAHDLIYGSRSNGSDERMYAQQWYDRCSFGMFPERTFLKYVIEHRNVEDLIQEYEHLKETKDDLHRLKECQESGEQQEELAYLEQEMQVSRENIESVWSDFLEWTDLPDMNVENEIQKLIAWKEEILRREEKMKCPSKEMPKHTGKIR